MKFVSLLLCILLVPGESFGQTSVLKGHSTLKGNAILGGLQTMAPAFFAALPTSWVNSDIANGVTAGNGFCHPPGGTFDATKTMPGDYAATFAGLAQAKTDQMAANQWWKLVVTAGTNVHGGTYSGGALMTWPASTGVTKCLVIQSSTHTTDGRTVCSQVYPTVRDPNCTSDVAKFWKFTIDTSVSGNYGMFFPGQIAAAAPSSYILVQDMEIAPAAGTAQSVAGVDVTIQVNMEGDHIGLSNSWIHGWNPGDSGQPGSVCAAWNRTGTVTTNGTAVTWVTGDQFGMDFSDGTNSAGYAAVTAGGANHLTINGVNYGIASHDPAASATTLTLATSAGVQASPVAFSMTNAATPYATGCGDDSRGIQTNCTNCFVGFSYFNKIHWIGNESHAISGGFTAGPVKLVYNFVEAGSSGIFFGGAPVDTRGGPVYDVELGNTIVMRDLGWRFLTAAAGNSPAPPFGCGPLDGVSAHDTCPFNWSMKNNIEMKVCNRCLVYSIILDGSWADGQSGYLLLLNVRAASGGQIAGIYDTSTGLPATSVTNVRFQDFWFRNCAQVVQMSPRALGAGNGGGISMPLSNVDFINGVVSNCRDTAEFGSPGADLFQWAAGGQIFNATVSRTSNVAHAVITPNKIANFDPGLGNVGTYSNAIDVTSVIRSSNVVTVKLNNSRSDPKVGGTATVGVQDWLPDTTFSNTQVKPTAGTNSGGFIFSTGSHTSTQKTGLTPPNWGLCQTPASTCSDNGYVWTNTGATTIGYEGTVTESCVAQNGGGTCPAPTTCSQNNFLQSVSAAIATQPQPCVRADGTFGDTFTFSQTGSDGTLCSSLSTCNQTGITLTLDTLAYKMHAITAGEGVYAHNCSDATLNTGATSFNPSVAPTLATGVDLYWASTGSDTSGVTCQVENSAGLPQNFSLQNFSVLSPGNISIQSNGAPGQHRNNWMLHNVFAATGTNVDVICTGKSGEGSNAFQCWDNTTFQFFDNILQGRSSGNWSALPSGTNFFPTTVSCAGSTATNTCMGWTGYMSAAVFPTSPCTYDGSNPNNCPLMAAPWSTNFALSKLVPVASSFYATEGANVTTMETNLAAKQYVCPAGAPVTCTPFRD